MKAVKAFWIFDGTEDKIVRFIGMPVVTCIFAIGSVFVEKKFLDRVSDMTAFGGLLLLYLLMMAVVIDVRYDQHRFGGTYTAHGSWLEYLKSSSRGRGFYRDVLYGSQITRLLYFCIILLLYQTVRALAGGVMTQTMQSTLFYGAVAYLAAQLGSVITRLIDADYVAYLVSAMVSVIIVVLGYVAEMITSRTGADAIPLIMGVVSLTALIAGILVGALLVRIGVKKKEAEYVDR